MENKRFDKELVKSFIEAARADLKSAEVNLREGIYNNSIYHSQQAVEKIVKALLLVHNIFKATHIVSPELKKIEKKEEIKKEILNSVKSLEEHWVTSRYPFRMGKEVWNPVRAFTEEDAKDALEKAKFVVREIEKILKEKYGIEV